GNVDEWILSNGQWTASAQPGSHPSGYQVAGVGDFTGNGTDDILWYNSSSGDVDEWEISYGAWAGSVDLGTHPGNYQIAGIGDFTGNGTDDILWTSISSNGQVQTDIWELSNGKWAASTSPGSHPAGYQVAGIGELASDGKSAIFWDDPTTGDLTNGRFPTLHGLTASIWEHIPATIKSPLSATSLVAASTTPISSGPVLRATARSRPTSGK